MAGATPIYSLPYPEPSDLVANYPALGQDLAEDLDGILASKLPYSYGTATPSTTDSGFLWYDSNSTPAAPKFWDGAAFQALTSGKILQVVRATDGTRRSTSSTSLVDVTGMSVTITPQKSDSAVLVICSAQVIADGAGTATRVALTDSSNNAMSGAQQANVFVATNNQNVILIGYATPATTSAVTYKMRFRTVTSGTAEIGNDNCTGQMYALEIAA